MDIKDTISHYSDLGYYKILSFIILANEHRKTLEYKRKFKTVANFEDYLSFIINRNKGYKNLRINFSLIFLTSF